MRDRAFVFDGEIDALRLRTIAQRRVEEENALLGHAHPSPGAPQVHCCARRPALSHNGGRRITPFTSLRIGFPQWGESKTRSSFPTCGGRCRATTEAGKGGWAHRFTSQVVPVGESFST